MMIVGLIKSDTVDGVFQDWVLVALWSDRISLFQLGLIRTESVLSPVTSALTAELLFCLNESLIWFTVVLSPSLPRSL